MKTLSGKLIIGAITLASLAGCTEPKIKEVRDFTGDGVSDIMLDANNNTYLFIGQKDGSYIKAKMGLGTIEDAEIKYFKTDDGKIYIFDGQSYLELPKNPIQ